MEEMWQTMNTHRVPILEIKGQKNFPEIQEPPQISGHQNYDVKHIPITKVKKKIYEAPV